MRKTSYLVACLIAVTTLTTGFGVRAQQDVPRPDSFIMLAAHGVGAQYPAPTAQFPTWGTCGETSANGLAAITAFQSAVPLVLGDPAKVNCDTIILWRQTIPGSKGGQSAYGSKVWPDDMNFTKAAAFLKTFIVESAFYRTAAITSAYAEVHGRSPKPAEMALWDEQVMAKKAWYATIASAEIKKLSSNEDLRQRMLDRAFEYSTGRMASDADLAYWLPRVEHYRLVVATARAWLYAPTSIEELKLAITRAYTGQYGKAPTASEVASRVATFSAMKPQPLYVEMMK